VIRERVGSHLPNIDENLADTVAAKLGLTYKIKAAAPFVPPASTCLCPPALSIHANSPNTFEGRKLGILVSGGVDTGLLAELKNAFLQERATVGISAPTIGVLANDGTQIPADERIGGAQQPGGRGIHQGCFRTPQVCWLHGRSGASPRGSRPYRLTGRRSASI
jgi:catalase